MAGKEPVRPSDAPAPLRSTHGARSATMVTSGCHVTNGGGCRSTPRSRGSNPSRSRSSPSQPGDADGVSGRRTTVPPALAPEVLTTTSCVGGSPSRLLYFACDRFSAWPIRRCTRLSTLRIEGASRTFTWFMSSWTMICIK
jgi:hypothetical protein